MNAYLMGEQKWISSFFPLTTSLQQMLLKMQKRLVIVKMEFHFLVLFLKPKVMKIFAFNDF
jgi:hypothetical protein